MTIHCALKVLRNTLLNTFNTCILFICAVFFILHSPVYATEEFVLFENDQAIYLAPHKNYEYLLSLTPYVEQQSHEQHLLWLQQKAAIEYLLIKPIAFSQSVIAARKLLTKTSSPLIKTKLLYYSGLISHKNNEYNKAISLFSEALLSAEKHTFLFVEIKKSLLLSQYIVQFLDDGLEDLQLAYIESFSEGDEFTIALINQTYGDVYRYKGELEHALDYYQKAYETYDQFGYTSHLEQVLYHLMLTYRDKKNDKEALEYLAYYEKIKKDHNHIQNFLVFYGYATIHSSLNDIFYESLPMISLTTSNDIVISTTKKNCEKALFYIEKALNEQGDIVFIAELLKRKARCQISLAQYEKAQQTLINTNLLYSDLPALKNTSWQLETALLAAQLAYAKQEYAQSFSLFEEYYQQSFIEQQNRFDFYSEMKERAFYESRNEIELNLIEQQYRNSYLNDTLEQYKNLEYQYLFLLCAFIVGVVIWLIVKNKQTQRKLFTLAVKNDITGLYNRHYMMNFWNKLLSHSSKKTTMSVLLIEVDNIDNINGTYGYKVKDNILCQLVTMMEECLRSEDTLGHLDGDKFLCILPRIDEMLTMKIAERLVELVRNRLFEVETDTEINITISIGVRAIEPSSSRHVDTLYNELVKALSRAKKLGKNQAVIFRERQITSTQEN